MGDIGAMELTKMLKLSAAVIKDKDFVGLIYGGSGVGKTALCRDAPRPILVHSFDPDGFKPLSEMKTSDGVDLLATGNLLVEDFSAEDLDNPKQYTEWRKRIDILRKDKAFFSNVGTFILDSATTFGMSIWAHVLKLRKKPELDVDNNKEEYEPAKNFMMRAIRDVLSLPCNIIVIAHEATY